MIASGFVGSMASKLVNLLESNTNVANVTRQDHVEGEEGTELGLALNRVVPFGPAAEGSFFDEDSRLCERMNSQGPVRAYRLRVQSAMLTRVAASIKSLTPKSALVVDSGRGTVYSWAGHRCGRVLRAVAEEMARRFAHKHDARVEHTTLGEDAELRSLLTNEDDAEYTFLAIWELGPDGQWTALARDGNGEEIVWSRRCAVSTLRRDATYLVDTWTERYLWHGREAAKVPEIKLPVGPVGVRPPFVADEGVIEVKDRFESVAFRDLFSGWADEELSAHCYLDYQCSLMRSPPKAIEGEASRMVQSGVGSLEVTTDASDAWLTGAAAAPRSGDDQRARLLLSLAEDALVRVWRVEGDALVVDKSPDRMCWASTEMILCALECKNRQVTILYSWEGDDVSIKARAASGLRVQELTFGDEAKRADHILHCKQHAEPPLLLTALSSVSASFLVIKGRTPGQSRGYLCAKSPHDDDGMNADEENDDTYRDDLRCIRVCCPSGIDGEDACLIKATEEPIQTSVDYWDARACYVIVSRSSGVTLALGTASVDAVRRRARSLASNPRLKLWLAASWDCGTTRLESDELIAPSSKAILHETFDPTDALCEHNVEFDKFRFSCFQPVPVVRHARLFEVNRAHRLVGSTFAIDLGRTFRQGDLSRRGCFILDIGEQHTAGSIFIWIGSQAKLDDAKLAVCVAVAYSRALFDDSEQAEVVPNCDYVANTFGLNKVTRARHDRRQEESRRPDIIQAVAMGDEPPLFVSAFVGWRKLRVGSASACIVNIRNFLQRALVADPPFAQTLLDEQQSAGGQDDTIPLPPNNRAILSKASIATRKVLALDKRLGDRACRSDDKLELTSHGIALKDIELIEALLVNLREPQRDELFAIFAFCGKTDIKPVANGAGREEFRSALAAQTSVSYGLITFDLDHVSTCKDINVIALVTYIPQTASPLTKGAVNSRRSVIRTIFDPVHIELTCDTVSMEGISDVNIDRELSIFTQRTSF